MEANYIYSLVIIKISLTNLVFELIIQKEFLLQNEFSEANLNAYKRILNWQPFMKRVYSVYTPRRRKVLWSEYSVLPKKTT